MTATRYPYNHRTGRTAAVLIRRYVNDEIARMAPTFQASIGNGYEFLCECGDLTCRGIVEMTLAEYRKTKPGSVVGHD